VIGAVRPLSLTSQTQPVSTVKRVKLESVQVKHQPSEGESEISPEPVDHDTDCDPTDLEDNDIEVGAFSPSEMPEAVGVGKIDKKKKPLGQYIIAIAALLLN
jgi:hypothetical protein